MLGLKVQSVVDWELEFFAAFLEKIDSVGVNDPLKRTIKNEIESREQFLVNELREEFHLFRTIFANIGNQIFYELLGQIHVAVQIAESHFRLDHPKLAG